MEAVMAAKLTLKLNSCFGKQHIINALRVFAKQLEQGFIKNGKGISYDSLHEEWEYEEKD